MPYEVQTPVFEGPFDLLLHLIVREQVDLYEVSLSTIVDAYLTELDRITADSERLDLDIATEFLLIAATLVELKARRLLPGRDDIDLDEELALWEERDLLLARLLECKTFKDVATVFNRLASEAGRSYPAPPGSRSASSASRRPARGRHPRSAAGRVPHRRGAEAGAACRPRARGAHPGERRRRGRHARDRAPKIGRTTFRQLTHGIDERLERIVRFLGILELCKQGLVDLDQLATFGDIVVTWRGPAHVDADTLADIDVYEG